MSPNVIRDLREALQESAGKPVEIEDAQTRQVYVLMTRAEFQRLVYDDSDLTEGEMFAAAAQGLADDEGWRAPGLDGYDHDDANPTTQ